MTDSLPDDLVDRARSLAPFIEAHADQTEIEGTMAAPVVEAIAESGLFLTLVPRELGGLEADIATTMAVFEELARADGSTGWSTMANITTAGLASIYAGDEGAKTMFADPDVVMAGMLGPVGTGTAVDGGFRVSGHFQFGSGSGHASWMGAGFIEMDGDEPAVTAAGLPAMRIAFMPREQVAMRGNWNVLGLAGTGSYDYEVDEVVVADDFTVLLLEAERRRGGRAYDIGFFGLVACGHAGFALGVGRRALDEIVEVARAKVRLGAGPIADQQLFQHDYAMVDAAMGAARTYVFDTFVEAERTAVAEGAPSPVQAQRMRQATTYATRVAADAARFAYTWAGSAGLRSPSVIQRCFRDISAGTQHIYVDNNTLTAYTQTILAG